MPKVSTFRRMKKVGGKTQKVIYSHYEFELKSGIFYQPHPAFAKDGKGRAFYSIESDTDISTFKTLDNFTERDTKELRAADYVYQIKKNGRPQLANACLGVALQLYCGS